MTSFRLATTDVQRFYGRLAGFMYLGNYFTAVMAVVGMSRIKGAGAFAERASRLVASETLYHAALTSMAVSWVILILQAYALYMTLAPVHKRMAEVAALLEISQAVIGAASLTFGFAIARVYAAASASAPLRNDQLELLIRIVNAGWDSGFSMAMLFFAPASLLFFILFFKSGYVPRFIASLGVIGSALMIPWSIAALIAPDRVTIFTWIAWVPMGIAEVMTALWLAIKGIGGRSVDAGDRDSGRPSPRGTEVLEGTRDQPALG